ncbi:male-specific lethal 3 homolog [Anopheles moucheti]|uniref:male-specific lethal 3 homolog n=1 Tax=Anopheles moucheti TaxID=186751 RepID=UPI0022F0D30A|nr:male-specific lethal 3 homolog [Anopheles moucheti]
MVSTRGHNTKYKFSDGEKVLCYEPDPTKAKVLYDSKVLEVSEGKDKRGRRIVEYLIHFQGWNSSWDRKVSEDFILKDTEENRQLQKDLAEKSQLYQGGYLYRKERKKQRAKSLTDRIESLTSAKAQPINPSSEDGSSCSNGFSRDDNEYNMDDMDEYYSSSVESSHEEEKVYLQAGSKFRKHLDLDQHLIVSDGMLVELPAKLPVVTVLEDFVRYYTIRQLFECGHQEQTKSRRRNSSALRSEHKIRDYEQIRTNVELCKEVADGLRVYFDFTLQDYLLYPQEKGQAQLVLAEENLRNFTYIASQNLSLDMLTVRLESPTVDMHQPLSEHSDHQSTSAASAEERRRRRLRSHKNEENEFVLDFGALQQSTVVASGQQGHHIQPSAAVECTGNLSPFGSSLNILRSVIPQNVTISREAKEILDDVFRWRILPSNAPAEPSMIYGAIHLARLIVKLPEFLSVTAMADEKLKLLLKFLDVFAEFIEEHEEWFGKQFYFSLRDNEGV